ncbi:hypothetical protein [Aureimonas psammosilenae]|uniref:hypothetical protein n=1 Tax=Aureimonas psammosilenae TaxID=2495496 RepID=UPI0012606FC1|nr:hypothetical protein [Aureimonas psammosilenae]
MTQHEISTRADIEERFQRAARTERLRRVDGVGPARERSSMPAYTHDWADKNGWGSERLKEERKDFFRTLENGITAQDITAMEECERWTADFVDNPKHRRALWAWAASKVGGMRFKDWATRESTNVKTAREWKNAAIDRVYARLGLNSFQRQEGGENGGFTGCPVSTYLPATVENDARTATPPTWRDEWSLEPIFDKPNRRFFRHGDAKPVHMPELHEEPKAKRKAA